MNEETRASMTPTGMKPWKVRMVCCGREMDAAYFQTYQEAHDFRESWTSGYGVSPHGYSACASDSGHRRAGIVEAVQ